MRQQQRSTMAMTWALAACLGLAALAACAGRDPLAQPREQAKASPTSLNSLAQRQGLLWGTAVNAISLEDPAQRRLIADQAGAITPENALKWDATEPEPGRFSLTDAKPQLAFARSNNLAVRGHALVWHQQLPAWLLQLPAAELRGALERHVTGVAKSLRGQIHTWDVVNEPLDDQGQGLRRNLWLQALGPDYIADALRWAHQADPSARLAINDYGLEGDDPNSARKRQALLDLVRTLRRQGVPLNAVGLQAHLLAPGEGEPGFRTLPAFLAELRKLGLQVQITELDVSDRELPADPALRDARVAATYDAFLRAVLAQPGVTLVSSWGLSDRNSWLNHAFPRADGLPQRPLPYDADLRPKSARSRITARLQAKASTP
jgi:endo-1,4-beta-xylanase